LSLTEPLELYTIFKTTMNSLSHSLNLSMCKHSDNIAFNIDGNNYTYQQLHQRVADLQTAFLQNDQIIVSIGIIANQDFETYAAIVAALLSGITYVPIEPAHPDERNNHIVRISKVNAIFCSDFSNLSSEFHDANKDRFVQLTAGKAIIEELKVIQTENPAYVLFTSGSTGVPKGVPISLQNLLAFTDNVAAMKLEINEKSRFLQVFELTFDLSVFSYLVPLLYGATVFTLPKTPFKQMAAMQLIEEQSITHVLSVPSFVSYLKPLFAKIKLPSVTNWLFCGEALKADMVSAWQMCLPNADIYNVYGPTEATIFCTSYYCSNDAIRHYHGIVSIGKPFEHIVFGLFDDNMPMTKLDTAAELCISGSQLTTGYLDDPEKNKMAFFKFDELLYYRSGDLCLQDKQGDYFFTGRNDTQVKINGYRVEIGELEYYAGEFPGIDESVVIVSANEKNDQQLLNLVYTAKYDIDRNEFTSFLATRIPSYMLPANIYFVESIPHNLNGKIDKKVLAEQISKLK